MTNYFLEYLSRETVLPSCISSIPSRISFNNSGSDSTSKVSFMLSYLSLGKVIFSVITQSREIVYKKLSEFTYTNTTRMKTDNNLNHV